MRTRPAHNKYRDMPMPYRILISLHALIRFALTAFAVFASPTFAYKVETHVWIAQELINEIERSYGSTSAQSGSVTINVKGKATPVMLDPEVAHAILTNKAQFRLGSIGPDAFPGIFEGQMTIHPGGTQKQWGTGDWLMHAVRNASTPSNLAFAYGMLVHAASDVFAHTYVNQYAGDVYWLTDGEVDVEVRHFLLEGYIADRLPPLKDVSGNSLGTPTEVIRRDMSAGIPSEFLRMVFFDNKEAASQFGANGAPHVLAIHNLNESLRRVLRKDGPLERVRTEGQRLAILYGTGYLASQSDLDRLNSLKQRLHDVGNKSVDQLQTIDEEFKTLAIKSLGQLQEGERAALAVASKALDELLVGKQRLDAIEIDLAKAVSALEGLEADTEEKILNNICTSELLHACERVGHPLGCGNGLFKIPCAFYTNEPPGCPIFHQVCKAVTEIRKKVNPLRPDAEKLVAQRQALEKAATSHLEERLAEYRGAIDRLHAASTAILRAEIELAKNAVDFFQRFTVHSDPLTSVLMSWLAENNIALDRYFVANAEAIANATAGLDPLDPLRNWLNCSAPAFMGVSSQIPASGCVAKSALNELLAAKDALEKFAVGHDPVLREVVRLKKELDEAIDKAKDDAIVSIASAITGADVKSLLEALKTKPTKQLLDSVFSSSSGSKPLIAFSQVSERIDADMGLAANGQASVNSFHALHNSVVLSKLAIVDHKEVNRIAKRNIYHAKPLERSNIMFRLARSIDGNHQWRNTPPPYPRSDDRHACAKKYGYQSGFEIFANTGLRRTVFNAIFKGPLSPALELPSSIGLSDALPASYPYRPSQADPYPSTPLPCTP